MSASIQPQTAERTTLTAPTTCPVAPRLRTVTGNQFPRKCACGCGGQIPPNPELRYVVDFSGPKRFTTSRSTCSHMAARAEVPPQSVEYDVEAARQKASVLNRGTIWLLILGGLFMLLLSLWDAIVVGRRVEGQSGYLIPQEGPVLFVFVLFLSLGGLALALARAKSSRANRVRITASGVEVLAGARLLDRWRWGHVTDRFRLTDCSKIRGPGTERYPHYYLSGAGIFAVQHAVTQDAFDAVLSAAEAHGEQVSSRPGSPRVYTYAVTIYDVRGARGAT
jgi:hypothetical protein